jgi:hypothetical protein
VSATPYEPVFILAPARSCSTICLALLAGHPALYGFPELLIFSEPTVGELIGSARRPMADPAWAARKVTGVLRAVAEVHDGAQDRAALQRAGDWLAHRRDWTTEDLLDHLLESVRPRIGLEKSPDTVENDEALSRSLRAYPGARLLHLTRHPSTSIDSMVRHWSRKSGADMSNLPRACAGVWTTEHGRILRLTADRGPGLYRRVRAEDLLGDPAAELTRILGWLGLDAAPETVADMQRTERWRFAGHGPERGLYGGDTGFLGSPQLRRVADPGPVRFDPGWSLTTPMRARVRSLAGALGYGGDG